jgi:hypothetical protein
VIGELTIQLDASGGAGFLMLQRWDARHRMFSPGRGYPPLTNNH